MEQLVSSFPSQSSRRYRGLDHFTTEIGAPTALLRAWTAQGMLRRMTFAYLGALIANFRAESAEGLGPLRVPADEFGGKNTNIRAISAKFDAAGHQIIMVVMFHADHIIGARFAHLRA